MNNLVQEILVFVIIGGTTLFAMFHVFRQHFALPIANWFLKKGKVKWAMRFRKIAI
jgi:hypothetical protein